MPNKRHGHPHRRTQVALPVTAVAKQPLDYVVYFFSIATPLFELPQAYAIFANKSAADVSILTWGFFLLDNIVWIIYAYKRKIVPLLVSTILYLLFELSIVVGILMYS